MDALSSIGNIIKPIASIGAPIAGFVGNLLGQHAQNAYTNNQTAYMQYIQSLAKNPALLSSMMNKATQPLSASLIESLNNSVQGDLGARGLGQAPGIFAQAETQALAPYLLSQQQNAQNQVLQSLGLGVGNQPSAQFPGQSNMTMALMQALGGFKGVPQSQPQQLPSQVSVSPGLDLPPTNSAGVPGTVPGLTYPSLPPGVFGGDQSTVASYPQATDPFQGAS